MVGPRLLIWGRAHTLSSRFKRPCVAWEAFPALSSKSAAMEGAGSREDRSAGRAGDHLPGAGLAEGTLWGHSCLQGAWAVMPLEAQADCSLSLFFLLTPWKPRTDRREM